MSIAGERGIPTFREMQEHARTNPRPLPEHLKQMMGKRVPQVVTPQHKIPDSSSEEERARKVRPDAPTESSYQSLRMRRKVTRRRPQEAPKEEEEEHEDDCYDRKLREKHVGIFDYVPMSVLEYHAKAETIKPFKKSNALVLEVSSLYLICYVSAVDAAVLVTKEENEYANISKGDWITLDVYQTDKITWSSINNPQNGRLPWYSWVGYNIEERPREKQFRAPATFDNGTVEVHLEYFDYRFQKENVEQLNWPKPHGTWKCTKHPFGTFYVNGAVDMITLRDCNTVMKIVAVRLEVKDQLIYWYANNLTVDLLVRRAKEQEGLCRAKEEERLRKGSEENRRKMEEKNEARRLRKLEVLRKHVAEEQELRGPNQQQQAMEKQKEKEAKEKRERAEKLRVFLKRLERVNAEEEERQGGNLKQEEQIDDDDGWGEARHEQWGEVPREQPEDLDGRNTTPLRFGGKEIQKRSFSGSDDSEEEEDAQEEDEDNRGQPETQEESEEFTEREADESRPARGRKASFNAWADEDDQEEAEFDSEPVPKPAAFVQTQKPTQNPTSYSQQHRSAPPPRIVKEMKIPRASFVPVRDSRSSSGDGKRILNVSPPATSSATHQPPKLVQMGFKTARYAIYSICTIDLSMLETTSVSIEPTFTEPQFDVDLLLATKKEETLIDVTVLDPVKVQSHRSEYHVPAELEGLFSAAPSTAPSTASPPTPPLLDLNDDASFLESPPTESQLLVEELGSTASLQNFVSAEESSAPSLDAAPLSESSYIEDQLTSMFFDPLPKKRRSRHRAKTAAVPEVQLLEQKEEKGSEEASLDEFDPLARGERSTLRYEAEEEERRASESSDQHEEIFEDASDEPFVGENSGASSDEEIQASDLATFEKALRQFCADTALRTTDAQKEKLKRGHELTLRIKKRRMDAFQ